MGSDFEQQQEANLIAFLNGETDDFNLYAVDPQVATVQFPQLAALGMTVESAGGFCPFQAEGAITARTVDGGTVPMRWYYRSRGGWASLSVALTQDEAYGPNPLFCSGVEETDEFGYSGWVGSLGALVGVLEPVKFLHYFPTFNVDDNHQIVPELANLGMGVRDAIEAFHNGDPRLAGFRSNTLFAVLHGRGDTVEEALADARTFKPSDWLVEHGLDVAWQRTHHDVLVEHMDARPFNPWLNTADSDDRTRPEVPLADHPFGQRGEVD